MLSVRVLVRKPDWSIKKNPSMRNVVGCARQDFVLANSVFGTHVEGAGIGATELKFFINV